MIPACEPSSQPTPTDNDTDPGDLMSDNDERDGTSRRKFADLVVLDRDYFAIPDADIKKIRSLLTLVGGKVVHDSGVLKA